MILGDLSPSIAIETATIERAAEQLDLRLAMSDASRLDPAFAAPDVVCVKAACADLLS